MSKIIYSKFSNDRKKEYAITTNIISSEEGLFVEKVAEDEEALEHVQNLLDISLGLEKQYEGTDFHIPHCEKIPEGIRMEYVEGQTLEEYLDKVLEAEGPNKCAEEILKILQELYPYNKGESFTVTEDFTKTFGKVDLPQQLHTFEWSDIDLIFPNIILTKQGKALIDYEWTYHFPVPMEYICFRCLHHYLDYDKKRSALNDFGLYEKMGISGELIGKFWEMEENFQRSIYARSSSLDDFHEKMALHHWKFPDDFKNRVTEASDSEKSGEFLRIVAEIEKELERQAERKLGGSKSLKKLIIMAAKAYPFATDEARKLAHHTMKSAMFAHDILFPKEYTDGEILFVDSDLPKNQQMVDDGNIVVVDYWMKDSNERTAYEIVSKEDQSLSTELSFSNKNALEYLQNRMEDGQAKTQVMYFNYRNRKSILGGRKEKIIAIVLFLLSVFRIGLQMRLPVGAFPAQTGDDGTMMLNALNLLNGNYLGEYDSFVLSKGISYPLFLVLTYIAMIPYGMMTCFLNIAAALVFLRGIKPLELSKKFSVFLYAVLLYLPIGLDRFAGTRVYRISIMPGVALLVAAFAIGAYLRRNQGTKKFLPWIIGEGLSLAFFYNIREDSIWIMPLILVILLIEIGTYLKSVWKKNLEVKKAIGRILIYCLPVLMLVVAQNGIKLMNYAAYGVAVTNDRASSSYADVLSDLYHIDGTIDRGDVWVTQEMLQKAIDASPTLATVEEELHENMEEWAVDGEVRGDLVGWAMREAMSEVGYYKDAVSTNEFYAQVHEELSEAFANGTLEERDGIYLSSQLQATNPKELVKVILKSLRTMFYDSTYYELEAKGEKGQGSIEEIRQFEVMTGQLAVISEDGLKSYNHGSVTVANWIIKIYRVIGFVSTILSVLAYLYLTLTLLKKRSEVKEVYVNRWLVMTGLILSAFVLCFGVMMAMRWFVDSVNVWSAFYTAAIFPYILIFKWMAIFVCYKEIGKKKI